MHTYRLDSVSRSGLFQVAVYHLFVLGPHRAVHRQEARRVDAQRSSIRGEIRNGLDKWSLDLVDQLSVGIGKSRICCLEQ